MRSTRWRCPVIGIGTQWRARNPMPVTHSCWPTFCAPTPPPTDLSPLIPSSSKPSGVLARAQQDAVWERTCAHNKLRSLLREYYPALLEAFTDKRGNLLRPEARALLATAPTPRAAAKLTITQLAALLRQAGRQRGIDADAARLQAIPRTEHLHHLPLVEDAFGRHALALLQALDTAATNAEDLTTATIEHFDQHPDTEITTSMPGLGSLTGARYWPRSAMTDPASPTPGPSRPTPAAPP
jgi:hypothetical protein